MTHLVALTMGEDDIPRVSLEIEAEPGIVLVAHVSVDEAFVIGLELLTACRQVGTDPIGARHAILRRQ